MTTAHALIQEYRQRALAAGLEVKVLGDGNMLSEIAIVGEAPGDREVQLKTPFIGGSGKHLFDTLRKYGITRTQVYSTNVVKRQVAFQDADSRKAVSTSELHHWAGLVRWELSQLPNLKYVLVLGNMALEALLGEHGITKWRGSVIQKNGLTYVTSFNPAMVMREPKWEVVFAFDMAKLDRVLRGKYTPYEIEPLINPSYNEAMSWLDKMQDEKLPVSFDIEVISGETACVGFANSNHTGMCISLRDRVRNTYSTDEERALRRRMQVLFAGDDTRLIAQNGSFDSGWLWYKDRIKVRGIWLDTMLAHHTLYPQLPHNLGFLTSQYTDHPYYKDEKSDWKEGGGIDTFWEYNIKDCCITRAVADRTHHELKQQKLDQFFFGHVMRLQPHLVSMTVHGLKIDMSLKEKVRDELLEEVARLRMVFDDAVREATGDPEYGVNPKSPKQLSDLLFNKLRLVGRGTSTDVTNRKRMSSHPKTSEAARKVLTSLDAFAEENKFLSTYAEMTVDPDGRARCEYKQTGVQNAPGRLSSTKVMWDSGANLQNQPDRAKPMFIADLPTEELPRGSKFLYADGSQAEARVVARIWNVAALLENFERAAKGGVDVHRANASRIFKKPYEEIPLEDRTPDGKPTLRFIGKRCVHGLNYRMGPDKLAEVCGISLVEAEQAWRSYHLAFPEIRLGWDATLTEVYKTRQLWTPMGRRLIFLGRLPKPGTGEGSEDAGTLDSIIAFIPQSTIGDAVSRAIYLCHEDPEWDQNEARMALNIHDALIAMIPDTPEATEKYGRIFRRAMEAPIIINGEPLVVPSDLKHSYPDEQGIHRWSNLTKLKIT